MAEPSSGLVESTAGAVARRRSEERYLWLMCGLFAIVGFGVAWRFSADRAAVVTGGAFLALLSGYIYVKVRMGMRRCQQCGNNPYYRQLGVFRQRNELALHCVHCGARVYQPKTTEEGT